MPVKDPTILLITFEDDLNADLLILELERQGLPFYRLNCENFPLEVTGTWSNIKDNYINQKNEEIDLDDISSAWFRRLPMPDLSRIDLDSKFFHFIIKERSIFLEGLLNQLDVLWVNRICSVSSAENKISQLSLAKKIGLQAPKTIITNDFNTIESFVKLYPNVICKPISSCRINLNNNEWGFYSESLKKEDICNRNAVQISPFIIQERIKRKIEVRLTVVGSTIFACSMEINDSNTETIDLHLIEDKNIFYKPINVPRAVQKSVFQLLKAFGLTYCCFDFVLSDNDDWIFLELNPSGQWGWIERKVGFPITESIVNLLKGDPKLA